MLKIGVLGAGSLGKKHIELIQDIPEFDLVGFYDSDSNFVSEIKSEFGVKAFDTPQELVKQIDVVDIVTPTASSFDCAVYALKNSKHLFIEKPISYSLKETQQLIKLNLEAEVIIQVGHMERFNPGFVAAGPYLNNPMFIEAHRLGQFSPNGNDIPVVLDLMIHDIDIVLSIVQSDIRKISANGVAVIGDTPDIANARLEFNNGCVANLTASRMSVNKMRKHRIFQQDAYIMVDFLTQETEVLKIVEDKSIESPNLFSFSGINNNGKKGVNIERPLIVNKSNAITEELKSLYYSIINNNQPIVSFDDGYNALNIAYQIIDKMQNGIQSY